MASYPIYEFPIIFYFCCVGELFLIRFRFGGLSRVFASFREFSRVFVRMLILRFFAGFCEFSRVLKNFYCEFLIVVLRNLKLSRVLRVLGSSREFSRVFASFRAYVNFAIFRGIL